jgi:hypothetical protein
MELATNHSRTRSGIQIPLSARSVQKEDYKIVTIRLNLSESAGGTTFLFRDFLEDIKSAGLRKHSVVT